MDIKPIKNEDDYQLALKRLDEIFDAEDGTPESDESDILALLIDEYENTHYKIEAPDPLSAIIIRMEELNLNQKDLVGVIGGKSLVSEVLNRKKKLSLNMVRKLEKHLDISASVLISEY